MEKRTGTRLKVPKLLKVPGKPVRFLRQRSKSTSENYENEVVGSLEAAKSEQDLPGIVLEQGKILEKDHGKFLEVPSSTKSERRGLKVFRKRFSSTSEAVDRSGTVLEPGKILEKDPGTFLEVPCSTKSERRGLKVFRKRSSSTSEALDSSGTVVERGKILEKDPRTLLEVPSPTKSERRGLKIFRKRSNSTSEALEKENPSNLEASRSEEFLPQARSFLNRPRILPGGTGFVPGEDLHPSRAGSSASDASQSSDRSSGSDWSLSGSSVTGSEEEKDWIRKPRSSSCSSLTSPRKRRNLLAVVLSKTLRRSKSKSADQSLGSGYESDIVSGFSRLAGSSVGSSGREDENAATTTGRTRSFTERRSSCSFGSRSLEETVTYTVQDNDTLNSVAARFDTTPSELALLNKLSSRLIFPGQVLHVPRKGEKDSDDSAVDPGSSSSSGACAVPGSDSAREGVTIASLASASPTPPERSDEHAFLENLRPPGSPRMSRMGESHSYHHEPTNPDSDDIVLSESATPDSERAKDRLLYDKFLRLDVRHITDGQGIVSGVLLVTPNTMMFDPNVSDPLVIEHGPEVYGMITQLDGVANAAMFSDIARIKNDQDPDAGLQDVYYPTSCPLHKKYAILKEKMQQKEKEKKKEEGAVKDPSQDQLESETDSRSRVGSFGEILAESGSESAPAEAHNPAALNDLEAGNLGNITINVGLARGESTTDPEPEVKPDVEPEADRSRSGSCVSQEELVSHRPKNPFASPLVSVCKRTPSEEEPLEDLENASGESQGRKNADRELENVIRKLEFDSHKPEAGTKDQESFDSLLKDAQNNELEFRSRHFSAGASALGSAPRRGRFFRLTKAAPPQPEPPAPEPGSSPESRGQKVLKRLSYPLSWMGESFASDPSSKDSSAPSSAGYEEQHQSESMFSKVFSSMHRNSVDSGSGLWPRVRDLRERDASSRSYLAANLPEFLDLPRRSSVETSSKPTTKAGASRVGYRSMVSVDDVPELFASIDKLIPKPARSCEDPPLYLRLRMAKPKRKAAASSHVMSYGLHRKKPVYWFSVPRDKADDLCRFFLLWAPDVYGACSTSDLEKRGLELLTKDTGSESDDDGSPTVRHNRFGDSGSALGTAADHLARESWEVVSFQNELRRALSQAESEIYVPERIGQSEIVTEEQIKQLALRLPARVAGCTWSLVFTTSQHGFSLNSLYRKMAELDNPVLLLIKDTQGNVFGAYSPVELRVSELFYGTGEAFLFSLSPELRVFHWSGENSYFVKGNNESLVFGAGDGKFGLWLDGDLYQGRSQNCKTFHNDPLNPDEDFLIRTVECWTFV